MAIVEYRYYRVSEQPAGYTCCHGNKPLWNRYGNLYSYSANRRQRYLVDSCNRWYRGYFSTNY